MWSLINGTWPFAGKVNLVRNYRVDFSKSNQPPTSMEYKRYSNVKARVCRELGTLTPQINHMLKHGQNLVTHWYYFKRSTLWLWKVRTFKLTGGEIMGVKTVRQLVGSDSSHNCSKMLYDILLQRGNKS